MLPLGFFSRSKLRKICATFASNLVAGHTSNRVGETQVLHLLLQDGGVCSAAMLGMLKNA
jgi:hypothetical protein